MKRVILILCILAPALVFLTFHVCTVSALKDDLAQLEGRVDAAYRAADWDGVYTGMQEIEKRWNRSRNFAAFTLNTAVLDEIEISLQQGLRYGEIRAKEPFIGEFTMFCMLCDRLFCQESLNLGELL